ncbi:YhcH/YjgK/YiaL family protein [Paenibacillus athensensis]|nr:YhcH/YjgK/YiaL family protein [Paenibacillus athensensis]MCD1261760.1 YhcH/YjgK/YiaL family protein [Paenibacillus athensensis]
MIVGQLAGRQPELYRLPAALEEALRELLTRDWDSLAPGQHALNGEELFAVVLDSRTRPAEGALAENHFDYADIHYLLEGTERIGWTSSSGGRSPVSVNRSEDVELYEPPAAESGLLMLPGMYAIVFPGELHRPGLCADEPEPFRKVVLKLHRSALSRESTE